MDLLENYDLIIMIFALFKLGSGRFQNFSVYFGSIRKKIRTDPTSGCYN